MVYFGSCVYFPCERGSFIRAGLLFVFIIIFSTPNTRVGTSRKSKYYWPPGCEIRTNFDLRSQTTSSYPSPTSGLKWTSSKLRLSLYNERDDNACLGLYVRTERDDTQRGLSSVSHPQKVITGRSHCYDCAEKKEFYLSPKDTVNNGIWGGLYKVPPAAQTLHEHTSSLPMWVEFKNFLSVKVMDDSGICFISVFLLLWPSFMGR